MANADLLESFHYDPETGQIFRIVSRHRVQSEHYGLGTFTTLALAEQAYKTAASIFHGPFMRKEA